MGFERSGEGEEFCLALSLEWDDVGQRWTAFGDGAGFVKHEGVDLMQSLEGGGVFEEDAFFCALAAADHDRDRRCQSEGAWTADDDDGDAHFDGKRERFTDDEPDRENDESDGKDRRHEHGCDLVGCAGDRRLCGVGIFDQADDLRQRCVGTNGGSTEAEAASGVDGACGNGVANAFFDRNALAGEGAFVNRGAATHEHAVDRNAPARTHLEDVADFDIGGVDWPHVLAFDEIGGFRRQRQKLADGVGCVAFGTGFEVFADGDEGDDHRCRIVVEIVQTMERCLSRSRGNAHKDRGAGVEAIDQRDPGTNSDEAVHIRPELGHGAESACEVGAVDDEDHKRQHKLNERAGDKPERGMQERIWRKWHHRQHRDDHQRDQEDHRGNDAVTLVYLFSTFLRCLRELAGVVRLGMVAGSIDRFHDRFEGEGIAVGHLHAAGEEIHRNIVGASFFHSALDSRLAGTAAHTADVKIGGAFFTHIESLLSRG